MAFTITKVASNNFTHFDGFKEMNFSNWEIIFNNTDNTLILQMRNGAPFPKKEVLATDVIIKNGTAGTPETFATTELIRSRLLELNYNPLVESGGGGGSATWGDITGDIEDQDDLQTALDNKQDLIPFSKGLISGDSTVGEYLGQTSIADLLLTDFDILKGCEVVNIAVAGNTIAQQNTAFNALPNKDTYDYIIVQVGLNDLEDEDIEATIVRYQNYIDAINLAKKPNCKVIIGSMIPCKSRLEFLEWEFGYTNLLALNEAIMGGGLTPITGVDYRVDTQFKALNDGYDSLAYIYETSGTNDGIHPNTDGRVINANAYRYALNNLGFLKNSSVDNNYDFNVNGLRTKKGIQFSTDSEMLFNVSKLNGNYFYQNNGKAFAIETSGTNGFLFKVFADNASGINTPATPINVMKIYGVGANVGVLETYNQTVNYKSGSTTDFLSNYLSADEVIQGILLGSTTFKPYKITGFNGATFKDYAIFGDGASEILGTLSIEDGTAPEHAVNLGQLYTPRVQTVTSSATVTPTSLNDIVTITAQATGLTLANPTGTFAEAQALMIRIKDNGTARSIAFGANYRAIGITLPTTTVANKILYLGIIYDSIDAKWNILGIKTEA